MNRLVFTLLFFTFSSTAWAGTSDRYTFTVVPSSPVAGQPFSIKVNAGSGSCHPLQPLFPASPQDANVIRFELIISDICTPNLPAQEQTYEAAPLSAGNYVFRYAFCGSTVFGYSCTTIRETEVQVVKGATSTEPHAVPASSWISLTTTFSLMLLTALLSKGLWAKYR